MTAFNSGDHPRGHINNRGSFSDKPHSEPESNLSTDVGTAPIDTAAILDRALDAYQAAGRTIGIASAKLVGERILAKYPSARYLELEEMEADTGFFGGEIFDDDGDFCGEITELEEDEAGLIEGALSNLDQNPPYIPNPTVDKPSLIPDPAWPIRRNPNGREPRLDLPAAADLALN